MDIEIDHFLLDSFQVQLGMTTENYGFNGIIGVDFMIKSGFIFDFKEEVFWK